MRFEVASLLGYEVKVMRFEVASLLGYKVHAVRMVPQNLKTLRPQDLKTFGNNIAVAPNVFLDAEGVSAS
jgi:hypothetical protein